MEVLQSAYSLLHHTTQVQPSSLDMVLLSIKSLVSVAGTFVIVVGVIVSLYRFFQLRFLPKKAEVLNLNVNNIRRNLGLTIVLGLEFIIAADVIETTTTPDYYSLGILGTIVLIRTFLSYSLSREISELSPKDQETDD